MPKVRDYSIFLKDIIDSIENIQNFTKALTFDEFFKDKKTNQAVIRNFEIIGEAIKNISPTIISKYPEIPWKQYAGLRDVVIHNYFGIDMEIIWNTIKDEIPDFKHKINAIIIQNSKKSK